MKIIAKKDRTPQLIDKLLKVWENSVRATHKFLSNEEILEIKKYVPQAKDFYEYMGFKVYQRNELDDQGKPYPVLYMRLER
ncbi:hypothetical protein IMSAG250_00468 [Clostridiales bacterium]|nr:hypothetical protein [Eubacterium sp.]GFI71275.1 hypothetical protein IMSAG250_00468 [Clostridiales bacterium]